VACSPDLRRSIALGDPAAWRKIVREGRWRAPGWWDSAAS
jgi:hypothetical protein